MIPLTECLVRAAGLGNGGMPHVAETVGRLPCGSAFCGVVVIAFVVHELNNSLAVIRGMLPRREAGSRRIILRP